MPAHRLCAYRLRSAIRELSDGLTLVSIPTTRSRTLFWLFMNHFIASLTREIPILILFHKMQSPGVSYS